MQAVGNRSPWLSNEEVVDETRRVEDTFVTFDAPTAPDVVPRTKPSRSLSSATLLKLQLFVIFRKPASSTVMHCRSCTLNSPTASVVPSTPKLWGTDLVKTVRSGPHRHDSDFDHDRMRTRNPVMDLEDQDLEALEDQERQDLAPQEQHLRHRLEQHVIGIATWINDAKLITRAFYIHLMALRVIECLNIISTIVWLRMFTSIEISWSPLFFLKGGGRGLKPSSWCIIQGFDPPHCRRSNTFFKC